MAMVPSGILQSLIALPLGSFGYKPTHVLGKRGSFCSLYYCPGPSAAAVQAPVGTCALVLIGLPATAFPLQWNGERFRSSATYSTAAPGAYLVTTLLTFLAFSGPQVCLSAGKLWPPLFTVVSSRWCMARVP